MPTRSMMRAGVIVIALVMFVAIVVTSLTRVRRGEPWAEVLGFFLAADGLLDLFTASGLTATSPGAEDPMLRMARRWWWLGGIELTAGVVILAMT